MSKLLELYKKWSYTDSNNNLVAIPNPGRHTIGTENTAAGQAVDFFSTKNSKIGKDVVPGFIPRRQKGETDYPLTDEKALDLVRTEETGGTHNITRLTSTKKYSDIAVRE